MSTPTIKIAVEGCCHGELDAIYTEIHRLQLQNAYKIDLLLICGDFQAVRNWSDLDCMAVPDKYKKLGGFHEYYSGAKTAPVLTIMIGGNHEASNYLWELYHGGWLAPNIYYLGHAGCVQVNGVRIAGASGIFKHHDFSAGHWERVPYDKGSMRSAYHVREFDIRRLSLLSPPTLFLSHDWPQHITAHGPLPALLRRKPHLRDDIRSGKLGSPPLMGLLRTLRPDWWFAAHLHCRFEARVVHGEGEGEGGTKGEGAGRNPDEIVIEDDDEDAPAPNPDEITLSDEEHSVLAPPLAPPAPTPEPRVTRFLALDKCLPKRQFLEVIDIPLPSPLPPTTSPSQPQDPSQPPSPSNPSPSSPTPKLTHDPEWLAITRALHPWLSTARAQPSFPPAPTARALVRAAREWVDEHLPGVGAEEVRVRMQFARTAPPVGGEGGEGGGGRPRAQFYPNPQTEAFCAMLGIENKISASASSAQS